ncbi:site-specific integrase [Bifidobacterium sp. ESL0728]|uniref:tyrosine-type recombinase/integrase n=1 Tax=Bifidobacterium sp. ESL0728 TaxID=2983220 RepID=UPI0023F6B8ED|nr:site-specific integrase [Bifidobacterium sp. ESL0728]WEV59717.1 site-specific integrase [Bifidobacterium sp. ESL0728]
MASITSYQTAKGTRYMVGYRKPDGSHTTKRGFKRKLDARRWATEKESSKNHGEFIDESLSNVTVGERSGAWLSKKSMSLKPSTYRVVESTWRKHVEPIWACRSVGGIRRGEVQEWVTDMAASMSASVVIRAYGILAGILDDAVGDRMIARNPARGVELPRKRRRKHIYLTVSQLYNLSGACVNKPGRVTNLDREHAVLVILLGTVGLRWGEAIGLYIRNVDMKRHRISVEQSATQVGSAIEVGTPKAGKPRTVIFPAVLDGDFSKLMKGKRPDDLLFSSADGGHLKQVAPGRVDGWFGSACRRAGIPRMTIHDLRHTAASLMVHSGANVKAVQRQLGHASASMTLDVYADLFDDDLDAVGEAMNSILLRNELKMNSRKPASAA